MKIILRTELVDNLIMYHCIECLEITIMNNKDINSYMLEEQLCESCARDREDDDDDDMFLCERCESRRHVDEAYNTPDGPLCEDCVSWCECDSVIWADSEEACIACGDNLCQDCLRDNRLEGDENSYCQGCLAQERQDRIEEREREEDAP